MKKTSVLLYVSVCLLLSLLIIIGCSDTINYYTTFFDSQGGTIFAEEVVKKNESIILPAPTKDGYEFSGWYNEITGGIKYGDGESSYTVIKSTTMYARWTKIENCELPLPPSISVLVLSQTSILILWDAVNSATSYEIYRSETQDGTYQFLTNTTSTFYTDIGLSTSTAYFYRIKSVNDCGVGEFSVFASATTHDDGGDDDPIYYTITFDSQGGTSIEPLTDLRIGDIIILATPIRADYSFNGWFSAATGGTKYGDGESNYIVTGNAAMYAQWTENTPEQFTVTFNANGGTVSPASKTEISGTEIILPIPVRGNHTFNGWFTAQSGGTSVMSPHVITANITLYAQWAENTILGNCGQINWSANNITICTEEQLRELSNLVDNNTRNFLGQTITLANDIEINGGNWAPIGRNITRTTHNFRPFQGTFNGNNNTISGIYINAPNAATAIFLGLFAGIGVNGTVKNLRVEFEFQILDLTTTTYSVGGLAGVNHGRIENCFAVGDIVSRPGGTVFGILAGSNTGTIENSSASGSIVASSEVVGILVGGNSGTVTNSNASGIIGSNRVAGLQQIGGLIGTNLNFGLIENSYSVVDIVDNINNFLADGLVGLNTDNAKIINSYATGSVSGYNNIGGLVGRNDLNGVIINTYATGNVSGVQYGSTGIGGDWSE